MKPYSTQTLINFFLSYCILNCFETIPFTVSTYQYSPYREMGPSLERAVKPHSHVATFQRNMVYFTPEMLCWGWQTIPNILQYVGTWWPNMCNMLDPTILRYMLRWDVAIVWRGPVELDIFLFWISQCIACLPTITVFLLQCFYRRMKRTKFLWVTCGYDK